MLVKGDPGCTYAIEDKVKIIYGKCIICGGYDSWFCYPVYFDITMV